MDDPRKIHCYTNDAREKMRAVEELLRKEGLIPKDMSGNTMNSLTYGNDSITLVIRNAAGPLFRVASAKGEAYDVDRAWHVDKSKSPYARTMFSFMADKCHPVEGGGRKLRGQVSLMDIRDVLEAI